MPLSSSTGQAFLKQINTGQAFEQHQATNSLPPVNGMIDSAKMRSEQDNVNHTTTSIQNGGFPENVNTAPNGGHLGNSELRDTLQQNYPNQSSKFSV